MRSLIPEASANFHLFAIAIGIQLFGRLRVEARRQQGLINSNCLHGRAVLSRKNRSEITQRIMRVMSEIYSREIQIARKNAGSSIYVNVKARCELVPFFFRCGASRNCETRLVEKRG